LRGSVALNELQNASVAVAMTWAAGSIDLIGYLALYGLYTANMSGNTIAMGHHAAELQWYGFARYGWAVTTFIVGLLAGAFLVDAEKRAVLRLPFPATLALEAALILSFLVLSIGVHTGAEIPPQPAFKFYGMVALLTVAMGLQNVTIRRVGGMNVYTTFVTGSLVKFGEALAAYLFWARDRLRHHSSRRICRVLKVSRRHPQAKQAALAATLWLSYLGGAIGGGFLTRRWNLLGLIAPFVIIMVITIYATIWPFLDQLDENDAFRARVD
jgi:uncharacterized membrane protein YoaK (UPF0700 family)